MGFLKFLKREKKEGLDELDLPPAPPPLEGFEEPLPEFPDLGEEKLPEPKFDFGGLRNRNDLGEELPSFPELENEQIGMQEAPAEIPEPVGAKPMPELKLQPIPEEDKIPREVLPKREKGLFEHERRVFRERPSGKAIYVRVDKFKAMLGSVNTLKSDLRKSEETLAKLEGVKNAKDKSFDKVKSSLEDLQRKLIFIDKTLFEGE